MVTKQNKTRMVYRLDYAVELMKKGYQPVCTMPNPQKPHLTTWVFEWTKEFEADFKALVREGRRNER